MLRSAYTDLSVITFALAMQKWVEYTFLTMSANADAIAKDLSLNWTSGASCCRKIKGWGLVLLGTLLINIDFEILKLILTWDTKVFASLISLPISTVSQAKWGPIAHSLGTTSEANSWKVCTCITPCRSLWHRLRFVNNLLNPLCLRKKTRRHRFTILEFSYNFECKNIRHKQDFYQFVYHRWDQEKQNAYFW